MAETTNPLPRGIPQDAMVWDNHACMPLRPGDDAFLDQLARCRDAGLTAISLNVGFGDQGIAEHVRMLGHFRSWLAARPDDYMLIGSAQDLRDAKASGRLAVHFDIEGMNALGEQASLVHLYYDLGVRWMLIAYNRNNPAGGGCLDDDGGLTAFGREVIGEMNRVGMTLCCTHTGYRTAREAIDLSADPVIFSHSNPRALWDNPRNIPDDLMRACAARGGVICPSGIGIFLGDNDNSTETFVRHILHALDVVGEDHVGIGLDYVFDPAELDEYVTANPALFPSKGQYGAGMKMIAPWRLPEICDALRDRGVSDPTLCKLLGGNLLRIADRVWR
ncbi:membrane dipeptidase [Sphingopyxis bauzanensis]|uniref:Membrane dipeptidase n=1 Tax=Sphingopyxis bauzanensis TaxID=651663 RepID=A0A246K0D7_9SPHN|nr:MULTISPECIES: membrane dipeptidase [Sphingopyxis]MBA4306414.1 membrane dipeptidase [Sphingopyxis sp.]OHD01936.1 MAG: hypothetical protein A2885_05390 [Sphingopyxis sp. RIFCSPHIGHO2_01_FULL_65_24]OWQ98989.1 membrane dipeptidase [Sphingopyxis bauzanensis]GGJ65032.1 membrane dipeptidase [Sphingopyxis bauzanensis]